MKLDFEKRKLLEDYLQKKVTITRIAKGLNVSRTTIYKELKLGLTDEDLFLGNYSGYSAERAQEAIMSLALEKVK